MEKKENMPIWVFLALSSISSRKTVLYMIVGCIAFTAYCFPWVQFFSSHKWIETIFLISDWSWFAMMVPMTIWYWMSLRWADNNDAWADSSTEEISDDPDE
jgi:hypothetical protein